MSKRISQWRINFRQPYRLLFAGLGVLIVFLVYQTQDHVPTRPAGQVIRLKNKTVRVSSLSGKPILVRIQYHHPYQVPHLVRAAATALHTGESLFGAYPYPQLRIIEWPRNTAATRSAPGQIMIAENHGWTADNHRPDQLDYVDYLLSREVFRQWLVHSLHPRIQPDDFIKQSLPNYLALQMVAQQYGDERLAKRLAQWTTGYAESRRRKPETNLLPIPANDAAEQGRGTQVLTAIEQVWGSRPLSLTISEFYRKGMRHPDSVSATAFANEMAKRLPDSLQYLRTYLNEPLRFDFRIGRIANLVNGLAVEILATKWKETPTGKRQPMPANDYVPLVVRNQSGQPIYRQLVRPNPDKPFVSLPVLTDARSVVIDPLGVWPEPNKRDNAKLF